MRILLLAIALLSCGASVVLAQDFQFAPVNPAFEAYIQQKTSKVPRLETANGDARPTGYAPSPRPESTVPWTEPQGMRTRLALPSSFDLRTQGKVTAVRDQGGCGSCWAFSTMAAIESELLPGGAADLSENNLKNKHGFDWGHCDGGNYDMSVAYMARNGGPVNETDDPYSEISNVSPSPLTPRKRVHNVNYLPGRGATYDTSYVSILKNAVMQGAVSTVMLWDSSFYNSATNSYYFNISQNYSTNHGVTIVGWDDGYLASNFNNLPAGNGAFLIKNSWGSGWGTIGGYFWISYYDTRLAAGTSVYTSSTASSTTYDRAYGYDKLGWVYSAGTGANYAWLGANFTASSEEQTLDAFGVYTAVNNAQYEARVYINPDNASPINATGPVITETGTIPMAGFHAVTLHSPVRIAAGQRFSVVVKLTQPGTTHPIAVEGYYPNYSSNVSVSNYTTFASSDGSSWYDMANLYLPYSTGANVCLKAYAHVQTRTFPVGVLNLLSR